MRATAALRGCVRTSRESSQSKKQMKSAERTPSTGPPYLFIAPAPPYVFIAPAPPYVFIAPTPGMCAASPAKWREMASVKSR